MIHADLCRLALQSDLETLSNPYTDSWILPGSPEQNVNMAFAGIDIETPEILLADRLNENEKDAFGDAAGMVSPRSLFLCITACPG